MLCACTSDDLTNAWDGVRSPLKLLMAMRPMDVGTTERRGPRSRGDPLFFYSWPRPVMAEVIWCDICAHHGRTFAVIWGFAMVHGLRCAYPSVRAKVRCCGTGRRFLKRRVGTCSCSDVCLWSVFIFYAPLGAWSLRHVCTTPPVKAVVA